MLYIKANVSNRFRTCPSRVSKTHLSKMDCFHAHSAHSLEIFLRRVRAALLVHNVSASEHNLNSDNNRDEFAHLRSGGGDD